MEEQSIATEGNNNSEIIFKEPSAEEFVINRVLESQPGDHRLQTYALALSQLPSSIIPNTSRVFEVGMSDRLLKFQDLFPKDTHFFGITLSPEEKQKALSEIPRDGRKRDILIRDLKDGVPDNWTNMDLALDVFSASHYWDIEETVKTLAKTLRKGGHLVVVPGDFMGDVGGFIRKNPEQRIFDPKFVYSLPASDNEKSTLTVMLPPNVGSQDETDARKLAVVVGSLKGMGYDIPENCSWKDVVPLLNNMCEILGEDTVSGLDGLVVHLYKTLEKEGLEDIKMFFTPDGTGAIGTK